MPKFEIELSLYRTVEAHNAEDAADIADAQKTEIINRDRADQLGWREAVTTVRWNCGE